MSIPTGSVAYGNLPEAQVLSERRKIEEATGIRFWRLSDPLEHVVGSWVISPSLESCVILRALRGEGHKIEFSLDWAGRKPNQAVLADVDKRMSRVLGGQHGQVEGGRSNPIVGTIKVSDPNIDLIKSVIDNLPENGRITARSRAYRKKRPARGKARVATLKAIQKDNVTIRDAGKKLVVVESADFRGIVKLKKVPQKGNVVTVVETSLTDKSGKNAHSVKNRRRRTLTK